MVVAVVPFRDGLKTFASQMAVAVLLPEPTGIWMPVQSKDKRTNRINDVPPLGRLAIRGKPHPSRGAPQTRLEVSLLRITLLHGVPLEEAVRVTALAACMVAGAELGSPNIAAL